MVNFFIGTIAIAVKTGCAVGGGRGEAEPMGGVRCYSFKKQVL